MRRWIVLCVGMAGLGATAWYSGKPASVPVVVIATPQAAVVKAPKPPAPKLIEVIDLARAYEPVREAEEVHVGGVDPASFIQVPEAAERIPPARDFSGQYADVIRTVREAPSFWSRMWGGAERERIDVMPRDVSRQEWHRRQEQQWMNLREWELHPIPELWQLAPGSLSWELTPMPERLDVMPRGVRVPAANGSGNLLATVMDLPFTNWTVPPIEAPVVERLDVMPRVVDGPTQDLLHFPDEFGWM